MQEPSARAAGAGAAEEMAGWGDWAGAGTSKKRKRPTQPPPTRPAPAKEQTTVRRPAVVLTAKRDKKARAAGCLRVRLRVSVCSVRVGVVPCGVCL